MESGRSAMRKSSSSLSGRLAQSGGTLVFGIFGDCRLLEPMSVLIAAQERDRSKVADKYTWNLADIYADEAAWRAEKDAIKAELPRIRAFAGRLGESPQ